MKTAGTIPPDHFDSSDEMVAIGLDAKHEVEDIHLSQYACYLIVQNADPAKEVGALGQTYFAVQTRRQKVSDAAALAELVTLPWFGEQSKCQGTNCSKTRE